MGLHCWRSWNATSPRAIASLPLSAMRMALSQRNSAPRRPTAPLLYPVGVLLRHGRATRRFTPAAQGHFSLHRLTGILGDEPGLAGGGRGAVAAGIHQGVGSKRKGPKPVWLAPLVARPST